MRRKRLGTLVAACVICVTLAIGIAIAIAIWHLRWNRDLGKRPGHLRQLGLSVYEFANQHNGKCPDSLEQMVSMGLIPADSLVCPASAEVAATGTGAELQKQLAQPGHNSYVYLSRGKTLPTMSPDDILIYEAAPDSGDGVNVCGTDAHVEWIPIPTLREALAKAHDQLR